ncbi:MAG: hypothetical protein AABY14_04140 [Nanoarchaeota archaeon]
MKSLLAKLEEKVKQFPSTLKRQAGLITPPIVTVTVLGGVALLYNFFNRDTLNLENAHSEVVRQVETLDGNVDSESIDNVIRNIEKSNPGMYYPNGIIIPNIPYYKSGSDAFYLPIEITRDNASKEVVVARQYLVERSSDGILSQSYRKSYDIYNLKGHKLGKWEQDRNDNSTWYYSFQDSDRSTKIAKYRINFESGFSIHRSRTDTINGNIIVRDLEDKIVYRVSEMGEFTKEAIPYRGDIIPDIMSKVYGDGKFFITDRQEIDSNTGAINSESGDFIAINPWIRDRNDRCIVGVDRHADKLYQKIQEEDTYKGHGWAYRKYVPAELQVEQK